MTNTANRRRIRPPWFPSERSEDLYAGWRPSIYDPLVVHAINRWIWRCPSPLIRLLYDQNVGPHHLDIGVGTGYSIDNCTFPVPAPQITLADMSPAALARIARRLHRHRPATCVANVLEPLPLPERSFDSVAMSLLLHTVPGNWASKGVAFANAARCLRRGGRLFGATVLGRGVPMSRAARRFLAQLNQQGVLSNADGDLAGLRVQLDKYFPETQISMHGCVAFFEAVVGSDPAVADSMGKR